MRRLNDEHGAAAVFVAILLVVLFGMGALVVDVGHMFWERRQLQNGGDAASLAVAKDIANIVVDGDPPPGTGSLGAPFFTTADRYADENSAVGTADIEDLTLGQVDNKPLTEAGEVTVTTLVSGGELRHWLAPVLGIDSSPVRATASAIYGALVTGKVFPFAVCETLWDQHGTSPVPFDVVYKSSPDPPSNQCDVNGDFQGTNPGNFGWLYPEDGECSATYDFRDGSDTGSGPGDPGADIPSECTQPGQGTGEVEQIEEQVRNASVPDELPVRVLPRYSGVDGDGNNATYTLTGFVAFRFYGVKMKGGQNEVFDTWSNLDCFGGGSNNLCVRGHFVKAIAPGRVDEDFESHVLGVELSG